MLKLKKAIASTVSSMINSNILLYRLYHKIFFEAKKGSLEEKIHQYSSAKNNIQFIQIGGNDGKNWDPVYLFVQRDKWQGVILEPQYDVFHNSLKLNYKNNKNVKLVNAALDKVDEERIMYKVSFSDKRWATGLTSFYRSSLEDNVNSGYMDDCAKQWGDIVPANKSEYITEEKVKCICFNTLFKDYHIDKLDFLVIDAEGYDYEIIKMFDFNRIMPKFILYEHAILPDRDECEQFLSSMGYSLFFEGINTLAHL